MTQVVLLVSLILGLSTVTLLLLLIARQSPRDAGSVLARLEVLERGQERSERAVREEMFRSREEVGANSKMLREEIRGTVEALMESNERRIVDLREVVDRRLHTLEQENTRKLDEIRGVVDEQLSGTLERRLGESFRQVSERLEAVHQGLGEMQTLAAGVGDLKRLLSNVKARGTWGEIQLGNLLEQTLSAEQYASNVAVKPGAGERVEFAIKLPGREEQDGGEGVWLPIDAKFPVEDFQRLLDAQDRGDPLGVESAGRQLEVRIKGCAKDIRDKYLNPPHTTDFAIMFVPTEGLYAEILRRPGLAELVQCDYRVVVAGPQTLAALLNSLQMGFRTLAIEKRSSEVWKLLGAVKTQFAQFGGTLEKVQIKLHQASETLDVATRRSRQIERRLRQVQELPADGAAEILQEPVAEDA